VVTVRTYHPRRGRLGDRHEDALRRLGPLFSVPMPHAALTTADLDALYPRPNPIVLEIGSGMGDATVWMALADPGRNYLAVEVHTPGVANLLSLVEGHDVANLRIVQGDALALVACLPPDHLDAVHAFFPDPWPKARHHKRRLIRPDRVALLRSRLRVGGTLHCATDWAPYAEVMLQTMSEDPELSNVYTGYAPRPLDRPLTKFEQRGLSAGRHIHDLVFRRQRPSM
jgi:tRNA (guanine-N7-)-methyltransferase